MRVRNFCAILIGMVAGVGVVNGAHAAFGSASNQASVAASAVWAGVAVDPAQCNCITDVDGTGIVNIMDVLIVYECANGEAPPTGTSCELADVDCDGVVDTCDASRVLCAFYGLTDCCANTVCGACCGNGGNLLHACEVVSEDFCALFETEGVYHGDETTCDPPPCECFTDADCDDGNVCTDDACGLNNSCEYTPVFDGTACSDGLFCTLEDACHGGECVPAVERNCDDGLPCTTDVCNEEANACVHSIIECNHDGVCNAPCENLENCPDDCACTATRDLSDSALAYCPSVAKTVHIALNVPAGALALGVEDSPPVGWTTIENISDGGVYDAGTHKVKWGPLLDPFPAELTYDVVAPANAAGPVCFDGTVSVNGVNEPICGDECVEELCCGYIPADEPAPAVCEGCVDCTCAACGDGRIEMCEMIGYACAWKKGCNDDLSGMVRAAFIWVSGECYCWDEFEQNWFASSCDSPSSCCAGRAAPGEPSGGVATLRQTIATKAATGARNDRPLARSKVITIDIEALDGVSTMALEYRIPSGWKVIEISDDGAYDRQSGKVKWGPYFQDLSRTVTFRVRGEANLAGLGEFGGTVSFDGVNHPIVDGR